MLKTISADIGHASQPAQAIWYQTLMTLLDECNPSILTRTADTGQYVAGGAVTRSINVTADYLIYKLSDGLGPDLYIKIAMGCGHNIVTPAIRISVGLGTDGAGSLTGILLSSPLQASSSVTTHFPVETRNSTAVVIPGQIAVAIGVDAIRRPTIAGFIISRPTDVDGNWTNEAGVCVLLVMSIVGATNIYQQAALGGLLGVSNGNYSVLGPMPNIAGSWAVNGEVQPGALYHSMPHYRPHTGAAMLSLADISLNTQFEALLAGATPKTYKNIGINTSFSYVSGGSTLTSAFFTVCPRIS